MSDDAPWDTVEQPVDGVIDLHTFAPREVRALLLDWLEVHAEAGFRVVRVIHGKGTGQLAAKVHATLARSPHVAAWRVDTNWGATVVRLKGEAERGPDRTPTPPESR